MTDPETKGGPGEKSNSEKDFVLGEGETYRNPNLFWRLVIVIFAIASLFVACDQIFGLRLFGYMEVDNSYLYMLIALLLSLVFIIYPASTHASRSQVPWYDVVLFAVTIGVAGYLAVHGFEIMSKGYEVRAPLEYGILAILLCLLTIEALRRAGGTALTIVVGFLAVYPIFASFMPGLLQGAQISPWDTAIFHALSSSSLIGLAMHTYGFLLVGFMLFASVLGIAGGGAAFMDLALALLGTHRGGPAKVCIMGSGLFGTMSGSVVSNIVAVGTITIPLMKKSGYPSHFAAAIEAVASTGGNIMPPVMGTVAFLMAQILGISYLAVAVAAAIPAIFYYFALFMQVDAYAAVHKLKGLPRTELPSLKMALIGIWPYAFSIFALVYFLYLGLEGRSPFVASAILLVTAMLMKKTRLNWQSAFKLGLETARSEVFLIGLMLGIGFVIGTFGVTGVGNSFAHELAALAGGNVALLLIMAAVANIILGMGMPIVPCYIFLAVILAPALVAAGINPLASHLFIMYWAMSSYLTPPVALGAFTAASIAHSNPVQTGVQACRLGIVVYLVPFAFVISPALILQGPIVNSIIPVLTTAVAVILLSAALEGYLVWVGELAKYHRILLGIAGGLLIIPLPQTTLPGAALMVVSLVILLIAKVAGKKSIRAL